MLHGPLLVCAAFLSLLTACSAGSSPDNSEMNTLAVNKKTAISKHNVNDHSAVKHLKARIILYTHTDFNQSQVEAILLPILSKESVLYLRKLATQGHVMVIKARDSASLQQKFDQINNLVDVKLLEQDAILSIKEK